MSHQAKMAVSAGSSTATASLVDWFKPLRSEAIARLRMNAVGLVGLTIFTNLLPVPSPWKAVDVVWRQRPTSAPYYYLCLAGTSLHASPRYLVRLHEDVIELAMFAMFLFNVLQASYALKYPRAPLPPPPSPAKPPKSTPLSPPSRQWRLSGLTPNVSSISHVPSQQSTREIETISVKPPEAESLLFLRPVTSLDSLSHHQLHHPCIYRVPSRCIVRIVGI